MTAKTNATSSLLALRWGTDAADAAFTGLSGILFGSTTLSTTALLLLASLFFLLLQLRSETHKKFSPAAAPPLPPGPLPWPIVGNLPELFINKPSFRWILGLMKELNANIACIRLGNVHIIPVNCPEIAREFLKKQDALFASRPITMGTQYSSRGFLSIAVAPWGDQWKKMRRVVASEVITPARLRWLLDKRVEEADNLIRYIFNQCNSSNSKLNGTMAARAAGGVVDVRVAVRQYSGNVIRKMMFNKRYFGQGSPDGGPGAEEIEHVDALFTVLSLLYAFCVSDYMPCLRWLDLNGHEKIMKKAIRIVNKYHDPIIDDRIKKWRGCGKDVFSSATKKEPQDLLDVLISAKDTDGKPLLSSEEIKAQTADLIYAAVDNPSNAVEWALAEMINQPEILRKAVEEIDSVVGNLRLVQESDFPRLNYVKACAREAFRLHPIAPFNLPHVSNADSTVAGYFIPKGSHVLLSRIGLGRNPKVWDLRFISFSTGRRGCMGAALGSAMTVMLLARLLQGFSWQVPPGLSQIDLSESTNDLFLAKPLRAFAKPRLPMHLYTQTTNN
uniref:Phenylalanine N-monooxygenase-like n=1 Tax=Nelumbo nucifera TaxID=4432 RepID=A0A822XZZ6_NELNU|nr:TPA_asm: hypothetical protein HUJ06_027255 [Nelumbo nucifera]